MAAAAAEDRFRCMFRHTPNEFSPACDKYGQTKTKVCVQGQHLFDHSYFPPGVVRLRSACSALAHASQTVTRAAEGTAADGRSSLFRRFIYFLTSYRQSIISALNPARDTTWTRSANVAALAGRVHLGPDVLIKSDDDSRVSASDSTSPVTLDGGAGKAMTVNRSRSRCRDGRHSTGNNYKQRWGSSFCSGAETRHTLTLNKDILAATLILALSSVFTSAAREKEKRQKSSRP